MDFIQNNHGLRFRDLFSQQLRPVVFSVPAQIPRMIFVIGRRLEAMHRQCCFTDLTRPPDKNHFLGQILLDGRPEIASRREMKIHEFMLINRILLMSKARS